jgi:hypothetical protein
MKLTSKQLKQIISEEVELMKLRKMIREEIKEAYSKEDIEGGNFKLHPNTTIDTASTAYEDEEDEDEDDASPAGYEVPAGRPSSGRLPPLHPKSRF